MPVCLKKCMQKNMEKPDLVSKSYGAIDLKSFYASVECVERGLDPLTTNLVVADLSRTEKTICLAVSPSLKAYGISGRARLFEVNQRLKEIKRLTGETVDFIIAPPRMSLYLETSSRIFDIYLRYVSQEDVHVYSIDECFIDLSQYTRLYNTDSHTLVMEMIRAVLKDTGITATAGIGTNLYLSKIAMDIVAKHKEPDSDGVRIAELDELSYRRILWGHRPITDFWRIGKGIAKRLERLGIFTMGDIALMSLKNPEAIFKTFGIDGEILIDHAWGYEPCTIKDIKGYKTRTNSLSSGQVLHEPYDYLKARIVLQEMADDLVLDMVDKGIMTDSLTLSVGYDRISLELVDYKGPLQSDGYGRVVPKSAHGSVNLGVGTSSTKKIVNAVLELYDSIVDKALFIRRFTLNANRIVKSDYEQYDLFTDPKELEREKQLQKTMLGIKKRFGKNSILKGMNLYEGATAMDRNRQIGGHKA